MPVRVKSKKQFEQDHDKPGIPVKLSELKKAKHAKYDKNCFGCYADFHNPKDPKEDPYMAILWDLFVDNQMKVTESELYDMISIAQIRHYITEYLPEVEEKAFTPWHPEQVEEHIKYHMFHYDTIVEKDIRTLQYTSDFLEDHIGQQDPDSGAVTPHKDNIDLLIKTIKERQSIIVRWNKEKLASS